MARDKSALPYPYEKVGPRKPPTAQERQALTVSGTASGRVAPPENQKADLARARAQLFVHRPRAVPRWVLAYVERKAPLADLLVTLKKRTLRAPSAANQSLAMDLINEASRTARGARPVARSLDQETVDALTEHVKGEAR